MRIRIIHKPVSNDVDGFRLDRFEVGKEYEVGNALGSLLLAERWAVPVVPQSRSRIVPLDELLDEVPTPANLIREIYPPYFDGPASLALERRRRRRSPR